MSHMVALYISSTLGVGSVLDLEEDRRSVSHVNEGSSLSHSEWWIR